MYTSPFGATAGYIPCPPIPEPGRGAGGDQVRPPSLEKVAWLRSVPRLKLVQPTWMRPKKGLPGVLSTAIISLSSPEPRWMRPTYWKLWQLVVDFHSDSPCVLSAA